MQTHEKPKKTPRLLIDGRRIDSPLWLVGLGVLGTVLIGYAWSTDWNTADCTGRPWCMFIRFMPYPMGEMMFSVAGWLAIASGVSTFMTRWVKGVKIAVFDDHFEFFTEYLSLVIMKTDVQISFYAMEEVSWLAGWLPFLSIKPRLREYLQFFDKAQDDVIVVRQVDMRHEDWYDLCHIAKGVPQFVNKFSDVELIETRKRRAFGKRR